MQLIPGGHHNRHVSAVQNAQYLDRYDIVNEADLRSVIAKLANANRDSIVTVSEKQPAQPAIAVTA